MSETENSEFRIQNSKLPRTVIILVDCLQAGGSEAFEPGSEGAFLLKLGSLLAGGSG